MYNRQAYALGLLGGLPCRRKYPAGGQAPDCGRHSIGFQDKCFNKLKSIKACGTNIVIVSHSLGQIEEICDYSIWLKDRKLEMLGDPGRFTPAIWNYFRAVSYTHLMRML